MTAAVASFTLIDSEASAANTTGNVAAPSGMGTGDLDLMFLVIGTGSGSVFTLPGGYTELFQDAINTGTVGRMVACYKSADASPTTAAITWSSYARYFIGGRFRLTGVNLANPINVVGSLSQGEVASNTNPTMSVSAATTTAADCLAMVFHGYLTGILTAPNPFSASGWGASGLNHISFENTNRPSACALTKVIASAGTTGTAAVATTGSDPNVLSWGGRIIGFNSAAGGGGGGVIRPRATWIM